MPLTSPAARSLVALFAITGVAATSAATASASATSHSSAKKSHLRKASTKKSIGHRTGNAADLVASGLHLDFSDTGFDVKATVANTGGHSAGGSDAVIAISDDTTLDPNDDVLEEYALPRIASGVHRSFETDVEVPDDLGDGTLYLLVCADGNTNVRERSETNNCVSQEFDAADASLTDTSTDPSADDSSDVADDSSDPAGTSAAIVVDDGE